MTLAGWAKNMRPIAAENLDKLRPMRSVGCGWISQVLWSPTGDMLAVCGGDGIAIYANAFGGAPTYRIAGHSAPVKGVAFVSGQEPAGIGQRRYNDQALGPGKRRTVVASNTVWARKLGRCGSDQPRWKAHRQRQRRPYDQNLASLRLVQLK